MIRIYTSTVFFVSKLKYYSTYLTNYVTRVNTTVNIQYSDKSGYRMVNFTYPNLITKDHSLTGHY
jgi:hypothetical protein